PGRNVNAIAVDVVIIADDVTHINTNAELNAPVGCDFSVALQHSALDVHRAAHGVNNADEFYQHTVASGLDDATAVFRDLGIDNCASVVLERGQCAFFINAH